MVAYTRVPRRTVFAASSLRGTDRPQLLRRSSVKNLNFMEELVQHLKEFHNILASKANKSDLFRDVCPSSGVLDEKDVALLNHLLVGE